MRERLDGAPLDLAVQPLAGRRKGLLVADMESTIIGQELLDELAAAAGIGDRIAAITARSLFATGPDDAAWGDRSWRYRSVWLGVLAAGAVFSLTGVRPVPAIIAAQALNGVLLPVVAIFLMLVMNDRKLLGDAVNGRVANAVMGLVVAIAVVLGARGLWRALAACCL